MLKVWIEAKIGFITYELAMFEGNCTLYMTGHPGIPCTSIEDGKGQAKKHYEETLLKCLRRK